MSAQAGRDLLLKVKNTSGDFVTAAGLRTKTIKLGARQIDVTHEQSPQAWRELLPGAGVKTLDITGAGLFVDEESDGLFRAAFFAQTPLACRVIIPDFGSLEAQFLISQLSYGGRYDGEAIYDLALSAAGAVSFNAL